ncbi:MULTISPECIES: hypothetical protein [unclassified Pseudoalteromonas]|uniref:hypothetical protein n=1 Tax=unclassified Pseudoalteromonas TaxID=194690 RepID=UPI000BBE830D|nr:MULTISPECIES: hypothetical protein [unclassified Pseudoalteromonas]ATG76482.1 hypothetical protein AOR04_02410 [Pseudoalteromonas sp. 1_2015MBL_MicDiv]MBB1337305.1 hypothetical protein [Pseudoalteromonas sp. SR44-2]MBB1449619.1 hypothetical protein [Pseudoalteromonas sp. SG43-1]
MDFQGRKILFIGIGFYDYDKLIVEKLKNKGAVVNYICQSHRNRVMNQFAKFKSASHIEKKHSEKHLFLQLDNQTNYDYIFVIKGDRLCSQHIDMLKKNNPGATFILYHWDSIRRVEGGAKIASLFDRVCSFDRLDCNKYSFDFIPLFYRNRIERKATYKYDISFVGWLHFNRLDLLKDIALKMDVVNKSYKFYLFTNPINWFRLNILKRITFIHRKTLAYSEYSEIVSNSNAILDFHHPKQDGLTMRTIEALGANRKIITTNSDIRHYDFYEFKNVFILDDDVEIQSLINFINEDFSPVPESILYQYSMDAWLDKIFSF